MLNIIPDVLAKEVNILEFLTMRVYSKTDEKKSVMNVQTDKTTEVYAQNGMELMNRAQRGGPSLYRLIYCDEL